MWLAASWLVALPGRICIRDIASGGTLVALARAAAEQDTSAVKSSACLHTDCRTAGTPTKKKKKKKVDATLHQRVATPFSTDPSAKTLLGSPHQRRRLVMLVAVTLKLHHRNLWEADRSHFTHDVLDGCDEVFEERRTTTSSLVAYLISFERGTKARTTVRALSGSGSMRKSRLGLHCNA